MRQKFERRPYQTRAEQAIVKSLHASKRVVAVGPTGSGKTVIAAEVIKRDFPSARVLWLAHRYELVNQAYQALTGMGVQAGVLMAQDEKLHRRADSTARVQVASVQTVAARGVPDGIGLVVFDEAHRVMADSYQGVAALMPKAKVLGLTATPVRNDGRGLGEFFRDMVIIAKPSELYQGGYLARADTYEAPPEVLAEMAGRMRGVKSAGGDYSQSGIARAMDTRTLIGRVVSESMRLAPGVPKVVFASGVAHSKRLAGQFARRGVRAEHLDAETQPEERERVLSQLADGTVEVVCNVDVLTEGWDLPSLGAVALARPTKSIGRYLQMVGRVQRPYKGRVPLVIDHANNARRLKLWPHHDVSWSLADGAERSGEGEAVTKFCVGCLVAIPAGCLECPSCGAEQESKKKIQELREKQARLENMERLRREEITARVTKVAKAKGAPMEWVRRVVEEMMR
jgi:DNA repair protein RadD